MWCNEMCLALCVLGRKTYGNAAILREFYASESNRLFIEDASRIELFGPELCGSSTWGHHFFHLPGSTEDIFESIGV